MQNNKAGFMKRKYVVLVLLVFGIFISAFYVATNLNSSSGTPTAFVLYNRSYGITVYESTTQQLEKGLMNATVTNSTFALFNMGSPGIYPFWMKDTYYPLDIIWLDYNQSTRLASVVYIANATPCVSYSANQTDCIIYTPTAYANYVLEAKAGFAEQEGIGIGTKLRLISG
jgi:uncharacterized membrane protein (UPF0127 family)